MREDLESEFENTAHRIGRMLTRWPLNAEIRREAHQNQKSDPAIHHPGW